MDRRFENVVPHAPASFDCAVERALHETEVEAMNRRKFSISLAWIMVALLALAGAAVYTSAAEVMDAIGERVASGGRGNVTFAVNGLLLGLVGQAMNHIFF